LSQRYKIILNPRSGNGNGRRVLPKIRSLLNSLRMDYDLVQTEYAGHAIELAQQAVVEGFDAVVAAGGDGTVNEVLNGLIRANGAGNPLRPLGVLCAGRGNDFAAGVDIPADLEEACQVLSDFHLRTIDIGQVRGGLYPHGRFFGNCVGVGFDAIATIEVAKLPRLGGFLSYVIAILKTIFLYFEGPTVRVEYDGLSLTHQTLLVSIMNGQRLGTGFKMAPTAKPDDGIFDLCIAKQVSRARILTLLPHFTRGTQASQDEIITLQGANIRITALKGSLPAQTDGEILCVDGKQLDISLLPRRLPVICSANVE
jgi:diacylglycerol kinase (ATP)